MGAQSVFVFVVFARDLGPKAHATLATRSPNHVFKTVERAAADKQDVGGIDLNQLLLGTIARTVRSDGRVLALEELEQRLLNTLAADIARHRGTATFA
jgi:hypothetical protein